MVLNYRKIFIFKQDFAFDSNLIQLCIYTSFKQYPHSKIVLFYRLSQFLTFAIFGHLFGIGQKICGQNMNQKARVAADICTKIE